MMCAAAAAAGTPEAAQPLCTQQLSHATAATCVPCYSIFCWRSGVPCRTAAARLARSRICKLSSPTAASQYRHSTAPVKSNMLCAGCSHERHSTAHLETNKLTPLAAVPQRSTHRRRATPWGCTCPHPTPPAHLQQQQKQHKTNI